MFVPCHHLLHNFRAIIHIYISVVLKLCRLTHLHPVTSQLLQVLQDCPVTYATSHQTLRVTRYVQLLLIVSYCAALYLFWYTRVTAITMNITTRAQAAKRTKDAGLDPVQTPKVVHLSNSTVQCVSAPMAPSDRSDVSNQAQPMSSMKKRDFALNRDHNLISL